MYYNYRNQMVRVTEGTSTTESKYDAFGRRLQKIVTTDTGSQTENYYYAGHQIVEVRDGSDNILKQYIYGNGIDEVIRMDNINGSTITPYYFLSNGIGSTTVVTDTDGDIVEQYRYGLYGMPTFLDAAGNEIPGSTIGNNILFQGREYEPETNFYYYRARHLDPIMGRFLSTDSMGYFDSMNLYAAFNMNPINFVDPLGEYKLIIRNNKAYVIAERGEVFEDIVEDLGENFGEKELREIDRFNQFNYSPRHIFHGGEEIAMPKSIFPDITADLTEKMRTNAKKILIINPFKFMERVSTGGEWDFKSQKGTIYESGKFKFYLFKDQLVRYDAPGNIHYGYVGKAAIWSWDKLLFQSAGAVQTYKKPEWNIPPYYGDDPVDYEYIKLGIDLYNEDHRRPSPSEVVKRYEDAIRWHYLMKLKHKYFFKRQ
jgi:RHS repeat-associated protein